MSDHRLFPNGEEENPLASLEKKLQMVCDFVAAVTHGFKTGFYLYGSGGIGKSFTVLDHLKSLQAPYHLYNSRMTGKALYKALGRAPDVVHVLEDMERLTKDPDAQGVLRSALWAQPGHDRVVAWTTAKEGEERFVFRGGLILISNRRLDDLPELRALATRIEVHRTCDWRDLVAASVREATHHFRHEVNPLSWEARRKERRNVLRRILRQTSDVKEQERLYHQQTNCKQADFKRRKAEVNSGEFDENDAA
jgi:hypothetical protein